jgi:hypothetical protein
MRFQDSIFRREIGSHEGIQFGDWRPLEIECFAERSVCRPSPQCKILIRWLRKQSLGARMGQLGQLSAGIDHFEVIDAINKAEMSRRPAELCNTVTFSTLGEM